MVIEGQVRVKCDAKVLGESYRYLILTKERYGDVTGQLGDTFPRSKQDKRGFVRINQKVFCVTPLCNTWRRHETMCFDANEKYIVVPST